MTIGDSMKNDPDELAIRVPVSLAERQAGQLTEETLRVAADHFREHGLCVLDGALDPELFRIFVDAKVFTIVARPPP